MRALDKNLDDLRILFAFSIFYFIFYRHHHETQQKIQMLKIKKIS